MWFSHKWTCSCFLHQLHTAVSTMLHSCTSEIALENNTGDFDSPFEEPNNPQAQTALDALQRDPIAIACSIINTIRCSPKCRIEF